ncbi:MAG: MFS transporter [Microvirgula sp.]
MSMVPNDRSRWLALAGVAIASFLGCVDFTVVNTALPAMQRDLGASIAQSQWVVTAFVMALSVFMVAAGRLADLHGRRRVLYAGMLLFGLASLGAGLAGGIHALIGWRLLQGLACAALYTASTAIVAHAFPLSERGRAIGLLFSANGLGLAIGPVLGGVLVSLLGWRWVFLLNVPLIAAGFALCAGHITESRSTGNGETLDRCGLLLLMLALPCLLLAITHGDQWGWRSARTLAAMVAGGLLFALLIRVERRQASPLIRFDLFGNVRFLAASAATFALAFFYCAAFFLMPLYLGLIRHQDSAMSGWLLLPTTAVMAAASPLAGRLADRCGTTWPLLAGFACLAVSAALQAGFDAGSGWPVVLVAFALMGLGWGSILGPSTVAALASVPPALSGVAMGASWTLHNLGGALGLSLATVLYRNTASQALLSQRPGLDPARAQALVADPATGAVRLAGPALSPADAEALISHGFLAGYQATMLLLLALSVGVLMLLGWLGRHQARLVPA